MTVLVPLFLSMLKIGCFAFGGGGYAILSLIGDSVLKYGWMTEGELLNFVGVETVIPGPIAVNMAPPTADSPPPDGEGK